MRRDEVFKQNIWSSSAILSSLTGAVRNFMIDQFDEGYFNYVYVSTGIPSVDNVEGDADRLREYRKSNPCLAIRPSFRFQNDTVGEYIKSPLAFGHEDIGPDSHFYTLYRNDEFLQSIKFALEYWKVDFTIGIRVESEVQGLDVVGYLRHKIFPGRSFYINETVVEEIPATILFRAAGDIGLDLRFQRDVKIFLDILQHNSSMPIDIKIKQDSGQRIVAFLMNVNILCKVDAIDDIDVGKKDRSTDDTHIRFNMTAQAAFPRQFKVYTEMPVLNPDGPYQDSPDISDKERGEMMEKPFVENYFGTNSILINYALTTEPPQYLRDSLAKRIFMEKFITSQDQDIDRLELSGMLPEAVELYINDMLSQKKEDILKESLIFKLYRDNSEVDETAYTFDFKNRTLILFQPFRNYIYRVVLYAETTVLHPYEAQLRDVNDLSQHFNSDILDNE